MKRHISLAAAIVPSLRGHPGASSRAIAGPRPARRRADLLRGQAVFPFLFAVIGMAPAIGVSTQPPPDLGPDASLAIVSLDTIGKEWGIGGIIGNVVGPDGSVYLVDRLNHQVLRVSPQGELVWRVGRQGRGPGEYMVPYRVAVRETGEVLVLDQSAELGHIQAVAVAWDLLEAGVLVNLGAHGQRNGLDAHREPWSFGQGGMTPYQTRQVGNNPAEREPFYWEEWGWR